MSCEHEDSLLLGEDPTNAPVALDEHLSDNGKQCILVQWPGDCILKSVYYYRDELPKDIVEEWDRKQERIKANLEQPFDIARWRELKFTPPPSPQQQQKQTRTMPPHSRASPMQFTERTPIRSDDEQDIRSQAWERQTTASTRQDTAINTGGGKNCEDDNDVPLSEPRKTALSKLPVARHKRKTSEEKEGPRQKRLHRANTGKPVSEDVIVISSDDDSHSMAQNGKKSAVVPWRQRRMIVDTSGSELDTPQPSSKQPQHTRKHVNTESRSKQPQHAQAPLKPQTASKQQQSVRKLGEAELPPKQHRQSHKPVEAASTPDSAKQKRLPFLDASSSEKEKSTPPPKPTAASRNLFTPHVAPQGSVAQSRPALKLSIPEQAMSPPAKMTTPSPASRKPQTKATPASGQAAQKQPVSETKNNPKQSMMPATATTPSPASRKVHGSSAATPRSAVRARPTAPSDAIDKFTAELTKALAQASPVLSQSAASPVQQNSPTEQIKKKKVPKGTNEKDKVIPSEQGDGRRPANWRPSVTMKPRSEKAPDPSKLHFLPIMKEVQTESIDSQLRRMNEEERQLVSVSSSADPQGSCSSVTTQFRAPTANMATSQRDQPTSATFIIHAQTSRQPQVTVTGAGRLSQAVSSTTAKALPVKSNKAGTSMQASTPPVPSRLPGSVRGTSSGSASPMTLPAPAPTVAASSGFSLPAKVPIQTQGVASPTAATPASESAGAAVFGARGAAIPATAPSSDGGLTLPPYPASDATDQSPIKDNSGSLFVQESDFPIEVNEDVTPNNNTPVLSTGPRVQAVGGASGPKARSQIPKSVFPAAYDRRSPPPAICRSASPKGSGNRQPPRRPVCNLWLRGKCPNTAEKCRNLHAGHGYLPRSKITCRYWRAGFCRKGDECDFAHSNMDDHAKAEITKIVKKTLQDSSIVIQKAAQRPSNANQKTVQHQSKVIHKTAQDSRTVVQKTVAASPRPSPAQKDMILQKLFPVEGTPFNLGRINSSGSRVTDEIKLNFFSQNELELATRLCGRWETGQLQPCMSSDDFATLHDDMIKRCSKYPMGWVSAFPPNWSKLFIRNETRAAVGVAHYGDVLLVIFYGTKDGYKAMGLSKIIKGSDTYPMMFRILPGHPSVEAIVPQTDDIEYSSSAGLLTVEVASIVCSAEGRPLKPDIVVWSSTKDSPEALAICRLFQSHDCKTEIVTDAVTSNGATRPRAIFIITGGLHFYKIPQFRLHLDAGLTQTYDLWGSKEWGGRSMQRLFPQRSAILTTNDIFAHNPDDATHLLTAMQQRAKDDRFANRASDILVTRPFMPPFLHKLARDNKRDASGDTRWIKLFNAFREICANAVSNKDPSKVMVTHVRTDDRLMQSAEEYNDEWDKDETQCTDRLVFDFLKWTYRHAKEYGHFTIVHETKHEVGVTDSRKWMDKYQHVTVLTPSQFQREMARK